MLTEENEETGKGPKEPVYNTDPAILELVKQMQGELKALKEKPGSGLTPADVALIAKGFQHEQSKDYQKGILVEDMPPEDYDPVGVTFIAPITGTCIVDDMRNGHRVVLPFNKPMVFFEYHAQRVTQKGKYNELIAFSTYTSKSKREQQWLKEHTLYGAMFYESSASIKTEDMARLQKLSRIMTVIKNMESPQLMARCKEYGVIVTRDSDSMRMQLAFKMVDAEQESEYIRGEKVATQVYKERKLLGHVD